MKISRYTTDIRIDDKRRMLYNTLSRQYYIYNVQKKEKLNLFLGNINKGIYTEEELLIFRELVNKKIIIRDEMNEWKLLEYQENVARYQEKIYRMIVFATNACNFRCTYCEQPHIAKRLDDSVVEKVLMLVSKQAKKNKGIEIDWFGGEPLLEYESICQVLEKAKEICDKETCGLSARITTNGYLLNRKRIKRLKELNVRSLQITLDGNREHHDKNRTLADGQGTYNVILTNIIDELKEGMGVVLRINVNEQNISDISETLDGIPAIYRKQVIINIHNIFQNKEKLSTFELLKQAIEKGYTYSDRWNKYVNCHACLKNAVVINTDGTVQLCPNTTPEEQRMGILGDGGNVCIERIEDYYNLHTTTARDNPECQNCIELPYCIGSCKYARLKDNTKCMGRSGDGLTLEERALLDYYYDRQKAKSASEN